MSKEKNGNCCICGNYGKLSFEHIPPEKAFNKGPARISRGINLMKSINAFDLDKMRTRMYHRGTGGHTLCESCNKLTGSWYCEAYIDWVYQAAGILYHTNSIPSLHYSYKIFPLRVIKQIISMFFSANGPSFREHHPELVAFILNKHKRYYDLGIKIFCYYNPEGIGRQTGVAGMITMSGSLELISEISYYPFGYIMLLDKENVNRNLLNISYFSRFNYTDWKILHLKIPYNDVYTYIPGDFRSKGEVQKMLRNSK